ncbi:MAG: hypothetical protein Q9221_001710 [Calogaya cf. arnoldii]
MHISTSTLIFFTTTTFTTTTSAAPVWPFDTKELIKPKTKTPDQPPPSGLDLTVYTLPGCKGLAHKYTSIKHNDHFADSPGRKSYRLSKDLDKHDLMTFESSKPFVVKGDARKEGCHDLPNWEAFWLTFMEGGEDGSG